MRLDLRCVELGLFASRNAAKEAILRGFVLLNGEICLKPSFIIKENDEISLSNKAQQLPQFVGRAGEKLWHFLGFLDSIELDSIDLIESKNNNSLDSIKLNLKDSIESKKLKQNNIESKKIDSINLDSIESSKLDSINLDSIKLNLKDSIESKKLKQNNIESKKIDSINLDSIESKNNNKKLDSIKLDSIDLIESKKIDSINLDSIESKNNNLLDSKDSIESKKIDSIKLNLKDSIESINNKQELKNLQCAIKSAFVLDVGSSTGGFAQCWLLRGARGVVCVDVGKDQLHKSLKENSNLLFFEETDIRAFAENLEHFSSIIAKKFNEIFAQNTARFNIISCDVSFISLSNIIQSLAKIVEFSSSCKGVYLLLLFKPQFEVGIAAKRDKRGVLKDKNALKFALKNILEILQKYNFSLLCVKKSEILGKEGNEEFFIACKAAK